MAIIKYKNPQTDKFETVEISGGTSVIANPEEAAAADLNKIQIDDTIYNVVGSGGGGGVYADSTVLLDQHLDSKGTYELNDSIDNYDCLIVSGWGYNVSSSHEQWVSTVINKEDYYHEATENWAFILNASNGGSSRRVAFYFPNSKNIGIVRANEAASIDKIYGIKFSKGGGSGDGGPLGYAFLHFSQDEPNQGITLPSNTTPIEFSIVDTEKLEVIDNSKVKLEKGKTYLIFGNLQVDNYGTDTYMHIYNSVNEKIIDNGLNGPYTSTSSQTIYTSTTDNDYVYMVAVDGFYTSGGRYRTWQTNFGVFELSGGSGGTTLNEVEYEDLLKMSKEEIEALGFAEVKNVPLPSSPGGSSNIDVDLDNGYLLIKDNNGRVISRIDITQPLVPIMTSDTDFNTGINISGVGPLWSGQPFWWMFNGKDNESENCSGCSSTSSDTYTIVDFKKPTTVIKYMIMDELATPVFPSHWLLQATNNKDGEWITLSDVTRVETTAGNKTLYNINIDKQNAYQYYRFFVPAGTIPLNSSTGWSVQEMQFYGYKIEE